MRFEDVCLESRPCPLGCPPDDEAVLTGRDRLHDLPGNFRVVRCRTCGLMRTDPRPSPDTMGFYYPDHYGPYVDTRISITRGENLWQRWKQQGRRWAQSLTDMRMESLPPLSSGRMLEIGCASGSFLHRMAMKGWQVEGIEFSATAATAARAQGYRVHLGAVETAPAPAQSVDLIVGWMLLEHLHEPVVALRKLHSWTRSGGWLAISVPNAASFALPFFDNAWFALHLPNHLYHYTPQTLAKVLDRGGWCIERVFYQRDIADVVASCGYVLKDRKLCLSVADRLTRFPDRSGVARAMVFPLGFALAALERTGAFTVWARKKDE